MKASYITPWPWRYYTEPQPNGCPIVGNDQSLMVAQLADSIYEERQKKRAIVNAKLISAALSLTTNYTKCICTIKVDVSTRTAQITKWILSVNKCLRKRGMSYGCRRFD